MKDISMLVENVKLNIRACIIIRNGNKVLMEKANEENSNYVFPGGRVKILENSIDTIDREVEEELGINIRSYENSKYYWISNNQLNELYILPTELKEIAFSNEFKHYINQKKEY